MTDLTREPTEDLERWLDHAKTQLGLRMVHGSKGSRKFWQDAIDLFLAEIKRRDLTDEAAIDGAKTEAGVI